MKTTTLCFLVVLWTFNPAVAQQKYEKESRIEHSEVPQQAIAFIDALAFNTKIKWYLEQGLNEKSIEAKFKHSKKKYSIEFDTLGNIQDIEIIIKNNDVKEAVKKSIQESLNTDCIKHTIDKIQIQYTGPQTSLLAKIKINQDTSELKTHYEVVVKCKNQESSEVFEYLFDSLGTRISKTKFIFKNSSHLEY